MITKRRVYSVLVVLGCLAGYAGAEFRPWTGVNGQSVEAEYVRMAEGSVVLRKRDGAEVKVAMDALCEEDRRYAMLQNPPRIVIEVEDKVDRNTVAYAGGREMRMESVMAAVSLNKGNSDPYDAELSLDVVLIGELEQLDRYTIIEHSRSTFRFTDENKGLATLTCGPVDLRTIRGNRNAGARYDGYLVIVRDSRDELVALKGSRLDFEKHADALRAAGKGTLFDKDFTFIREGGARRPRPGSAKP